MKSSPSQPYRLPRALSFSECPVVIAGVHDTLSAVIADEAGFGALWASGLGMATIGGYRDGDTPWVRLLDSVEAICDRTCVPVLVDCDTGFGSLSILQTVVRRLGVRGAAGLSIEDKTYPKTNSLIRTQHDLCSVQEFSERLIAAREAATRDDFKVIGRIEAFVAEQSLDEALRRANAADEAGADGIIIQSNRITPTEIIQFSSSWQSQLPLIVIPTTYDLPVRSLQECGISAVIYANQLLRASAAAMKSIAQAMVIGMDPACKDQISPVSEIFRIMKYQSKSLFCLVGKTPNDHW